MIDHEPPHVCFFHSLRFRDAQHSGHPSRWVSAESVNELRVIPRRVAAKVYSERSHTPCAQFKASIHGIVRQRLLSPMKPMRSSIEYTSAPIPASGIGNAHETSEVRTRYVPEPNRRSANDPM